MKNIFKIIFILCLGIFVAAGCADDSSGGGTNTENTGGDNTGDGDNNGGDNDTPEFTKLISAEGLSYGETADGKRYVWGNAGELAGADNKDDEVTTPVEVDFTINKILDNGTKYVLTDKGLYAWGNNLYGQVGNGTTTENVTKPYKAVGGNIKEFRVLNVGGYVTYYALTDDGLYVWGNNKDGQVGNGTTENVTTPYKTVDGNIKEVIDKGYTTYVLTDKGLYAWGNNKYGQVGNGTTDDVLTPHKVEGIDGTIKEIIKGYTVYVLTENGALYAWGDNRYGQVGNGTTTENVTKPHKVEGIYGNIKEVINHYDNTVYVLTDKGLYAWGNNKYGQVGNGTTTENVTTPHKVEGIDGNINEFIYYYYGTVYVLTDTGLYAWGNNEYGEVGNGESGYEKDEYGNDDRSKPKKVLKPHKVEGIAGNIKEFRVSGSRWNATCYALTADGLYAWGNNEYGQVGNGNTDNVLTPYKAVAGNIKEFRVSGSDNSATYYALTDDGLYAWGDNYQGQVGNGTTEKVLKPYKAVAGNIKEFRVSDFDSYSYDTYYALTDKGLYAWGNNEYGQVGNGESGYEKDEYGNDYRSKPKKVLTPYKAVAGNIKEFIISGSDNSATYYALTDKGLYAWGNNEYGQVGNGESGYEKDEYGNDYRSKPKKVLTPYEVQVKQN